MRKGFTLIELSIVLIIIGLLVGSILVSKELIRGSRIQTIVKDVAGFQSAVIQFKQKYGSVPGDMSSAQSYWDINANCGTIAGTGTGTQTCNGNGDGHVTLSSGPPYEQFLVWQHLADGAFITGQYNGTSIAGATAPTLYCSAGVNCPGGKVAGAQSYFMQYASGPLGSTTMYWDQPAGHYLIVGAGTATTGYPAFPLLTPAEAYALDSKVDDGMPGQGLWKSVEATGGAGYLSNCVVTNGTTTAPADGTVASQPGSVYYTRYTANLACSFEINLNF